MNWHSVWGLGRSVYGGRGLGHVYGVRGFEDVYGGRELGDVYGVKKI